MQTKNKGGLEKSQEYTSTSSLLLARRGKGWVVYQQATPLEQGLGLESSFWAMPSSLPAHFCLTAKRERDSRRKGARQTNHIVTKFYLHGSTIYTNFMWLRIEAPHTKWEKPYEAKIMCHQIDISLYCRICSWEGIRNAEKKTEMWAWAKKSEVSTYMLCCNKAKRFDRFIYSWERLQYSWSISEQMS